MTCSNSPFEETANEVNFSHGFIQDRKHQQSWEESSGKGGERLLAEYERAAGKQRPCSCHREGSCSKAAFPSADTKLEAAQKAHTMRLWDLSWDRRRKKMGLCKGEANVSHLPDAHFTLSSLHPHITAHFRCSTLPLDCRSLLPSLLPPW